MEDIAIYFKPVSGDALEINSGLINKLNIHTESNFPNVKSKGVAIIGLSEYRKSSFSHQQNDINAIRNYFYRLQHNSWNEKIYDLGDILPGDTYEDTEHAVIQVMTVLNKMQIVPLFVGGSQNLTISIYKSFEKLEQTVNIALVDPSIDMGESKKVINENTFLLPIVMHQPSFLFNLSCIGYQSYFVKEKQLELMDKLYFDTHRLGYIHQNFTRIEPLMRNTDILSLDMNSIRYSDFKNYGQSPHGFYGEQACAIMRYAGITDKLSVAAIQNFSLAKIESSPEAHLIAQLVWHFIDGYCNRYGDYPVGSKKSYTKYTVVVSDFKDEIAFYKSDKSGRWWMEVPYPIKMNKKFARHYMVPCNYEDYQMALKDEIPDLWWKTFQKLT